MAICVFDIDGTIANIEHRKHLIETSPKQWDKFFELSIHDKIIEPICIILLQLSNNNLLEFYPNKIVLATGRPERTRMITMKWLWDNLGDANIAACYMRSDNDRRPDHIIKLEQARAIENRFGEISMWFDDRAPVINALRNAGIFVIDVNQYQVINES